MLDLCAAPGGKSTELLSKLGGTGLLHANDISASRAQALRKNLELAGAENAFVTADLSRENLEQMGFGACDTVVICLAEKLDVSLLTALHAVNMGVSRVIAKAVSAEHGALLEKIGAEVVYPERDMGAQLAKRLCTTSALEYM